MKAARLVLIDGHAILHRAYHALPSLTTSKGEMVNAVYGFISMLLRVIHDFKPSYIAVTFDRPTPTFRNKLFKEYQAKRPKMEENLVSQVELVHKVLHRMGIPIFEMDGYEADDIIGTLVHQTKTSEVENQKSKFKTVDQSSTRENNIETIIVTGDRDLLQLVDDRVKVYLPVKGLSEAKLYGAREVEDKFGIAPSQIVDYKALVGDQSDNYPGVPGIGPKTAKSLLSRFKTLEQIYSHIDDLESEDLKKKLIDSEKSAELAKKLATIVTDVPLVMNLDKCRLAKFDRPDVHRLFEELEFRSLIPKLSENSRQKIEEEKKQKSKGKTQIKKDTAQSSENINEQISLFQI